MKNYWTYFIASLISLIGSNFFIFTQGWYLLEITGEKTSVGITWSLFFLPSLLLLPMIGILLDKFDLKKVMINFEVLKILIFLLFVPLLKWNPDPVLVYALAIAYGIAFVTYYPSVYVIVKHLVPEALQTRYSHVFELSLQVANIVGCVASGFIYEQIGFLNLLLISVLCFVVGWIGMTFLKLPEREKSPSLSVLLGGYRDVYRILKRFRSDGALSQRQFLFGVLHQFPQAIILVGNIPIILYVSEIMQKGPAEFGVLDAVISIAAAVVSLFWSQYHEISRTRSANILISFAAGAAVCLTGFIDGSGLLPYAWMVVYGSLLISSKILARGAIVRMIPPLQMGTYSALFQTCAYSLMMVLFLCVSFLTNHVGVTGLFVFLGAMLCLYGVAVSLLYFPEVKTNRISVEPLVLKGQPASVCP